MFSMQTTIGWKEKRFETELTPQLLAKFRQISDRFDREAVGVGNAPCHDPSPPAQ